MIRESAWEKYNEKTLEEVFEVSERYKKFLSEAKTERECVSETIKLAKEAGYRNLEEIIKTGGNLKPGDKVYAVNMDKSMVLFCIGKESMEQGMNILGAHIDSPRLDLKQNPLYEESSLAMLDTHYYGGIKKYQWVTLPLAIHGVVVRKDGSVVKVAIGEKEEDPVIGISDLLIHLAGDQMDKKGTKVVEGEDLNVLVGSIPLKDAEEEKVKANILALLRDTYGVEEEDFLSAELEVVPAGKARDYGLDRSMVMGYGHDDRVCAFTSLEAMLMMEEPVKTCACILVDKEEIGSVGATGMHSRFFENVTAELMECMEGFSELKLRRAFQNSKMLSSDVSAAYDPNYPKVNEQKNTAYFGKGFVFNKYTGARGKSGSNDANAEYMAKIRKIMDDHNVSFQTAELGRVDQGGGGTIAYIMAAYNMQVIDAGIGVQNMHAPWEVVSKADIYEAVKGYEAFLADA